MFENIIGHSQIVRQLAFEVRNNRLPGSILIEGPRYSGKLTLALELARALTCCEKGDWNCTCKCCRNQKLLIHPDTLLIGYDNFMEEINFAYNLLQKDNQIYSRYLFIRSIRKLLRRFDPIFFDDKETKFKKVQPILEMIEEKLNQINPDDISTIIKPKDLDSIVTGCADLTKEVNLSNIPVNQIRKITFWAHTSTTETRKVVIMENAEKMNDSARNSMLKILEEPPANCFFIFLSSRSGEIIPTIKSRLRSYSLNERSSNENSDVIKRIFRDNNSNVNSISEYFDSFNPDSEAVHNAAESFYSYFQKSEVINEEKYQLKELLNSIDEDSFKALLENILNIARKDIETGSSFNKTKRIEALCKKINDTWYNRESLNMNPHSLLEELVFFAGEIR